jgi:hypothetical protein
LGIKMLTKNSSNFLSTSQRTPSNIVNIIHIQVVRAQLWPL